MQEAKQSIAFYRRVEVTAKEVEVEIQRIKLQLDPRIDEILHGEAESKYFLKSNNGDSENDNDLRIFI